MNDHIIRLGYQDAIAYYPLQWYSRDLGLYQSDVVAALRENCDGAEVAFCRKDGRLILIYPVQSKLYWEVWLVFDRCYDWNKRISVYLAEGPSTILSNRDRVIELNVIKDPELGKVCQLHLVYPIVDNAPAAVMMIRSIREWIQRIENRSVYTQQPLQANRPSIFQRHKRLYFNYVPFNVNNPKCIHVVLSDRAYNTIISETLSYNRTETGGVLIGHIYKRIWYVMEVIPPGIFTTNTATFFQLDADFVNYLAHKVGEPYAYPPTILGFWHRHPGSMDYFSGQDEDTLRDNVRNSKHGMLSMLVNIDPELRMTFYHAYNSELMLVRYDHGNDYFPEGMLDMATPEQLLKRPYVREGNGRLAIRDIRVLMPDHLPRSIKEQPTQAAAPTQPAAPVQTETPVLNDLPIQRNTSQEVPLEQSDRPEQEALLAQADVRNLPPTPMQPDAPEQAKIPKQPEMPEQGAVESIGSVPADINTVTLDLPEGCSSEETRQTLLDYIAHKKLDNAPRLLLIIGAQEPEMLDLAKHICQILHRNGLSSGEYELANMQDTIFDPASQAEKLIKPFSGEVIIVRNASQASQDVRSNELLLELLNQVKAIPDAPTLLFLCEVSQYSALLEQVPILTKEALQIHI